MGVRNRGASPKYLTHKSRSHLEKTMVFAIASQLSAFSHFVLENTINSNWMPKIHSQLLTCRWNCQLGGGVEDRLPVVMMGIEDETFSSNGSFCV